MSSKITWTLDRVTADELRDPFAQYHYKGEQRFMRDHCYAATCRGERIAFIGTSDNQHNGRLLWLVVLPDYDGYGIGLKLARLAASLVLRAGFARVSFITEKQNLSPLLSASGWTFDRKCHPSPHTKESAERKAARLKVWQYRYYMDVAPEVARVGMTVTSGPYGVLYGDSCVIESRGRPRKHVDEQTRWRHAKRAQRERQRETTGESTV